MSERRDFEILHAKMSVVCFFFVFFLSHIFSIGWVNFQLLKITFFKISIWCRESEREWEQKKTTGQIQSHDFLWIIRACNWILLLYEYGQTIHREKSNVNLSVAGSGLLCFHQSAYGREVSMFQWMQWEGKTKHCLKCIKVKSENSRIFGRQWSFWMKILHWSYSKPIDRWNTRARTLIDFPLCCTVQLEKLRAINYETNMHKIAYTAERIEINLSVCIAAQIYYLLPVDTHILFYTLFLLCSVFPCRHRRCRRHRHRSSMSHFLWIGCGDSVANSINA